MKVTSSYAPVAPRGVAPVSGESLPLVDIVSDQINSDTRTICITGHGKSTALAHLAAEFFGKREVQIFDGDVPSGTGNPALTVFASQLPNPQADMTIQLCEWGLDDVIEYLMAKCPSRCKSVMSRLAKSNDLWLGNGAPNVMVPVLNKMIDSDQHHSFADALVAHFNSLGFSKKSHKHIQSYFGQALLDKRKAYAFLVSLSPKFIDRSTLKLLNHEPVRFVLSEGPLVESLKAKKGSKLLASPWPIEFVNMVAKSIRNDFEIRRYLVKHANGPGSKYSANSASLLAAIDKNWRPTHETGLGFARTHLQNVSWSGVVAKRSSMTYADLSKADLRKVNLFRTELRAANLSFADLTGATIKKANASNANFSHAKLRMIEAEEASLQSSNLENVDAAYGKFGLVDFREATLKDSNFSNADLSAANFRDASLTGTNFTRAKLLSAKMSDSDLRSAKLDGATLTHATLKHSNFAGLKLTDATFDGAKFGGAIMTASKFRGVSMQNCLFVNAKLADIDWEGCDLRESNFQDAHFHMGSTRSGLVGSSYPSHGTRTGFYTDDFDEQHFKSPEEIRKANLRGCDLRGAKVTQCDFYLVDLRDAKYNDKQREHFERCNAILADWVY